MRRSGQKTPTLDDVLNTLGVSQADLYSMKYQQALKNARATKTEEDTVNALNIRTGYYSMRYRVKDYATKNPRPYNAAYSWLFKTVFKNPGKYRYAKRLMYQGGMFIFDYLNPKYRGTSVLPWFDKYPLVISLGPVVTNQGVRNIGFNLHLLPPKIRIVVMCAIFEMNKRMYRYQVFMKQNKPVMIRYQQIVQNLRRYGVKFCVRMYIPMRQRSIARIPIKDWHKAVFLPSRGYEGIRAKLLIKEWRAFCRREGISVSENIDWRAAI